MFENLSYLFYLTSIRAIMHVILNTINGVENCQRWVPLQKEGGDTWLDHKRSKLSRSGVWRVGTWPKNRRLQLHATTWEVGRPTGRWSCATKSMLQQRQIIAQAAKCNKNVTYGLLGHNKHIARVFTRRWKHAWPQFFHHCVQFFSSYYLYCCGPCPPNAG